MGVTGPELLTKKTLPELILPVEERIAGVVGFLEASDPSVARNVVEISDIFGPAITIPELRCIVGSQETEKGCVAINQRRTEIGMEELDIHLIHIIEAEETRQEEEVQQVGVDLAGGNVCGRARGGSLVRHGSLSLSCVGSGSKSL